eukprot:IDg10254t1
MFIAYVEDLTANVRKVLLTFDFYRSHMTIRVLELLHANEIELTASTSSIDDFDHFSYCRMMTRTYTSTFTRANIQASFSRKGIWPLYPSHLLYVSRPRTATGIPSILFVEEVQALLEELKQDMRNAILGANAHTNSNGYVNNVKGEVLTSARALKLALEKASDDKNRQQKSLKTIRYALSAARRQGKEQNTLKSVTIRAGANV